MHVLYNLVLVQLNYWVTTEYFFEEHVSFNLKLILALQKLLYNDKLLPVPSSFTK